MPKQVDHQQCSRHIGEAVLRLIAIRGLEAASLRNVAAEAGVSMGTVQDYFTSKQETLDFAQRCNYGRAHLDADNAARHLYAVVEGLRWPTLIGAYTPTRPWPSLTSTSRYCSVSSEI